MSEKKSCPNCGKDTDMRIVHFDKGVDKFYCDKCEALIKKD